MKLFKAFLALLVLAVPVLPLAAQAQVKASLVSADTSIQPGTPFTVAVRMEHEPHWHSYWLNAGTGYPTSLEWDLPKGWTAGDIQWPTPIKIMDASGAVTGNGYEGVLYLPVTITPPKELAVGSDATLKVSAKWLMCADVCIPGEQAVSLTLPVSVDPPKPNDAVRAELAKMPMPQSSQNWEVNAARNGDKVTLQLTGLGAVKTPFFFSQDAYIQYDGAQQVSDDGKTVTLTLPVAEDAAADTQNLLGILAYTDAKGEYRGINLDVALGGGAATGVAGAGSAGKVAGAGGTDLPGVDGKTPASFLFTLGLAFLGGLILNLMPCVFPVLGIKVMGFVNQADSDRKKVTLHGLTFTAGVVLSFWALATALAIFRAGGESLGWGFQLQSPGFLFVIAVIMLVFAMSLSGVFEFGVSATGVGGNLQMKEGYAGSFFTGILATIVATPCSAPFLAPALGAAFAVSTFQAFVIFTMIAIGLSAPYLLLSIFPQAVKYLPRPGKWMETFKQVMAFPLYATVGYMVWVLAGQTDDNGLLAAILGLTVIALAVWLYGRYRAPGNSTGRMRFGLIGGLVVFVVGAMYGWPKIAAPTDIQWEPWSTARIEQLREEGRPIYVDFTARWCVTCQANKKVVFHSDEVLEYFHDKKVATLRADWTKHDPLITAELAKWQRAAIPFNLVYLPGKDPMPLPEILTPGIVLDAFRTGAVEEQEKQVAMNDAQ